MRVGMTLDWHMNATSLVNLTKNMFRELGLISIEKKSFVIAGIKVNSIGIGDVNQHYSLIHIPNMGGYRFPKLNVLQSKNLLLSPSGIDEVILGQEVFKNEQDWKHSEPIILEEIKKWKKYGKQLKAIHVVTESEKQDMMKFFEIPEEKFHIIPHGVDHDIFKPPKDKYKIRKSILSSLFLKDFPFFIHVSESNWSRKNLINILKAYEKAKYTGLKHNLIIVGKNDPIIYDMAKHIPGVIVLGFVSEQNLVDLLGTADAIILPSKHEGFGLPLLEAMSCGTPSITSNVFSPPLVVQESGILVDPYNVDRIAEKMILLGKDENLRNYLAKKAHQLSLNYSWKKTAAKLYDLYCEVTDNIYSDFEKELDICAYRTITTICEINPDLKAKTTNDLLKFDYSKIINWCLESGLQDPRVKDFLIPYKGWLENNSK
ncbi:MAG: glycosyltransferase family 4 protein [Nitrosopumilus sp.]|nr:glycosyltransferase family 4 protein [Nitrosopumilus sp.]MDH3488186.1 glycosyltransferase family 4 protein [Nitrosopumilus sp.]